MRNTVFPTRSWPDMCRIFVAFAALVLLMAPGCGGGGGGDGDNLDPEEARRLAQIGHAALNDLLLSPTPPSQEAVRSVHTTFSEAYARDPNNVEAAFGYGLMEIAMAVQDLTGQTLPVVLGRAVEGDLGTGLRPLDAAGWMRHAALAPLSPIGKGRQAGLLTGEIPRERVVRFRESMGRAIPAIQRAADTPGFSFAIVNFRQRPPGAPGTLTADQGGAQALLALLYAARAVGGLALAYDTSAGGFNFDQPIAERFAAKPDGAIITPDEYLPPVPFLTLMGDGPALFAEAKVDLTTAADTGLTALTTLAARPSHTGHVLDTGDVNFTQVRAALLILKDALSNPYAIPGNVPVTVNLNAWFTNPPANLRALLPTYHVQRLPGEMVLQAGPGDYPDRTLGGLLVNPPLPLFVTAVRGSEPVRELYTPGLLSEGIGGLLGGLTGLPSPE